ncbi:MAG: hypothetical protein JWQ09_405 [Segetibacter sp.]|nr:hypothetical protein [Segetibacter sp.]
MQITLIRTGGIIPITKKAVKDVDWSEEEMRELLKVIKNEEEGPGQERDATGYQLMYNAGTFSIDWEKIPAKYKKTFEELKEKLAIVKT